MKKVVTTFVYLLSNITLKCFEKKILRADHEAEGCINLGQTVPVLPYAHNGIFFDKLSRYFWCVARMLHR